MVWCGAKNGHKKGVCLKEIGPCVQLVITILDRNVNIIERDLYGRFMSTQLQSSCLTKVFLRAPE